MMVKNVIEQALILLNETELFEKLNSFDLDGYAKAEYVKSIEGDLVVDTANGGATVVAVGGQEESGQSETEETGNETNPENGEMTYQGSLAEGMTEQDKIEILKKFKISDFKLEAEDELKLEILYRALKLIFNEVCIYYLPFKKSETIEILNKKFYYQNLKEQILDVFSIKNSRGEKLSFKQKREFVEFAEDVKNAVIEYSFYPAEFNFCEKITLPTPKLLYSTLAYGVAREYCVINGDFLEATTFEEKFASGVENAMRMSRNIVMKARRWA